MKAFAKSWRREGASVSSFLNEGRLRPPATCSPLPRGAFPGGRAASLKVFRSGVPVFRLFFGTL
jgi:hypothetical protein